MVFQRVIATKLNRAQARALVQQVPAILSGRASPATAQAALALRNLQLSLGVQALSLVRDDYVIKSRGGIGEAGDSWPPLSPITLALRTRNFSPTQATINAMTATLAGEPGYRKALFRNHWQRLQRILLRYGKGKSEQKHALYILEKMKPHISSARYRGLKRMLTSDLGKKKELERLHRLIVAGAFAEILRNTGVLLSSLSPGTNGPSGDPNQVFDIFPGETIVGTNVKYAKYHHSDDPRKLKKDGLPKLPQRRLWPRPERWPDRWNGLLNERLQEGTVYVTMGLFGVNP